MVEVVHEMEDNGLNLNAINVLVAMLKLSGIFLVITVIKKILKTFLTFHLVHDWRIIRRFKQCFTYVPIAIKATEVEIFKYSRLIVIINKESHN